MISYLKSVVKHGFDVPYIGFNLYSNIIVPSWVEFVDSYSGPNRGVMRVDFNLS
jgi:hypothetical protein